jgi:hypothetical protein
MVTHRDLDRVEKTVDEILDGMVKFLHALVRIDTWCRRETTTPNAPS